MKQTIDNRYQIIKLIGQGSMGKTYAAIDLKTQQKVAIKAVSLYETQDWKTLELFEREAKVLANLDHPSIPNYLDYFHSDITGEQCDRYFYLVQELVEGQSLDTLIQRGWKPKQKQILYIAQKVLEILHYLHSLHPPVIHRDIKPQNILLRPDGKVYLVDFGAVQEVYRNTLSFGGTFVGTLGYIPLEQFRGKVVPASDLYSLGCTLLFLLTQKSPADLPQKRMHIQFRDYLPLYPEFATWLEKMVNPAIEDRFPSAAAALDALQNKPTPSPAKPPETVSSVLHRVDHPDHIYTKSVVQRSDRTLLIIIPTQEGSVLNNNRSILEIHPHSFTWEQPGFLRNKKVRGNTKHIILVEPVTKPKPSSSSSESDPFAYLAIWEGDKEHKLGFYAQLSIEEVNWLVQEISNFLEQLIINN